MKALVGAFNEKKALVGAFSVITNLRMELLRQESHLFDVRYQDGLALRGGEEGAEEPGVEPLRRRLEEDRGPGRVLRPRIPLLRQVYILIY